MGRVKDRVAKRERLREIWRYHSLGWGTGDICKHIGISPQAVAAYKRMPEFHELCEKMHQENQLGIIKELRIQSRQSFEALQELAKGKHYIKVGGKRHRIDPLSARELVALHKWFVDKHPDAQPKISMDVQHGGAIQHEHKITVDKAEDGQKVSTDAKKLLESPVIDVDPE